jgi:putative oxidoreductase
MTPNTSLPSQAQHAGLLLLRVVPSGIMMTHGWPKFQRLLDQWDSEEGVKFFDFMGLGPEISLVLTVLAELVAPALMIVGFQTRWAAIPAAFTMGVAAFVVHGSDPLGDKELALLYLVCFAAVALLGPGKWSVDQRLQRD